MRTTRFAGSRRVFAAAVWVSLATLVATSCSSGIGLRERPNPWTAICAHERGYLDAVSNGDQESVDSAVADLKSDLTLFPDDPQGSNWLDKVYRAAAAGDAKVAQGFWEANCAPLPSPSPS